MRLKKIFLGTFSFAIILLSANSPAKSFTKEEINKMVKTKKFPKLGSVQRSDKNLASDACMNFVSDQRGGFGDAGYPTKIIKESSTHPKVEIWGSNAKSTLTCNNGNVTVEVQEYA